MFSPKSTNQAQLIRKAFLGSPFPPSHFEMTRKPLSDIEVPKCRCLEHWGSTWGDQEMGSYQPARLNRLPEPLASLPGDARRCKAREAYGS